MRPPCGDWPYVQYRDILHRAWEANRTADAPQLKVIALGPPEDWRKLGIRYDAFLADRVRNYATDDRHRVLVYCGMHHAFTHYLQVERLQKGRATEFMDRMGNILWRQFGQDVFLVALHKPWGCGEGEDAFAKLCAPLGGAIDCAAAQNGGTPVGFDILGSPIAETKLDAKSFYATAHPLLRMVDFVDGYIWQEPVDDMRHGGADPARGVRPRGCRSLGESSRLAEACGRSRQPEEACELGRPAGVAYEVWTAHAPVAAWPPTPQCAPRRSLNTPSSRNFRLMAALK